MKGLLLLGMLVLLSGCMPPTRTQSATKAAPALRPDLPRILYRVVLISPPGLGTIELRQESQVQGTVETPVYRAYGGILASDDVAHWRFTYIKTSLEGPGAPGEWVDGLHAISVPVRNGAGSVLAALTMCVPTSRMTPARRQALVTDMREAGHRFSESVAPLAAWNAIRAGAAELVAPGEPG